MKFHFTLDKSGPAKTWPAGPAPTPMYLIMLLNVDNIFVTYQHC